MSVSIFELCFIVMKYLIVEIVYLLSTKYNSFYFFISRLMYQSYKNSRNSMASPKLKVILFLGTVRDNRLGLRVAKFMQAQLELKNYEVDFWGK